MFLPLIRFWLRIRISISNFLNRFDFRDIPDMHIRVSSSLNDAKEFIKDSFAKHFKYKYDFGDRIRTPKSTYVRAFEHAIGMLRDDCDGFASFAYGVVHNIRDGNDYFPSLLTIVPVDKFWHGHTILDVTVCKKDSAEIVIGGFAVNYGDIVTTMDSVEYLLAYMGIKDGQKYVISWDEFDFDKNKWVHVKDGICN